MRTLTWHLARVEGYKNRAGHEKHPENDTHTHATISDCVSYGTLTQASEVPTMDLRKMFLKGHWIARKVVVCCSIAPHLCVQPGSLTV